MFTVYTQFTNVAADCRPMVQNTPQYDRHTFWNPTLYSIATSYDLKNTPHYNKDILLILKPHSINFMN
jgi:hypothetical protein